MRRLRKLRTDYDIREALDDLPSGIEDTISRALETIDAHPNSGRLRGVLRLAIYAVQPLTLRELAEGAATGEMIDIWDPTRVVTDPMSLIDDCANLLICTPGTLPDLPDVVIPFHASVKEFLANPARITWPLIKYALYPQSVVHTDLARQCLSYLKLRCKDGGISLGIDSSSPFAKYAVEGWVEHIRASGSDALFPDFRQFLAPRSATLRMWAALCEDLGTLRLYDKNGVKDDLHLLSPEHFAVRLDLAKMIPHFGQEELMAEDHNGSTPLGVAVERSSSLALLDFLSKRVDVNQANRYGETALHIAALSEGVGNAEAVFRLLLGAGADPHFRNEDGQTALHLLMNNPMRALSCMSILLQHKADIHARDALSRTPLHIAAIAGLYDEARLSYTGDEDGTLGDNDRIAEDYLKLLWTLLNNGADLRCVDSTGDTPLHLAAQNGNAFAVLFLLNHGASVNASNDGAHTPLHQVVSCQTSSLWSDDAGLFQKHKDFELTVKHLLDHGADVNARIRAKCHTPLHLAAISRCQISIMALLVDRGARVTCIDTHRITPLHLAAKMAPIFDSHKAPDKWRISWVAFRIIIVILIRHTNMDDSEWDKLCAQVVRLLSKTNFRVRHPSSSEKINRTEKTHGAVRWFSDALQLLYSRGASVNARNDRRHNVLQYAMLFWASWISNYHASLLCNDIIWGPDEMTKEAAEVEWTYILELMHPRTRGQLAGSSLPTHMRRHVEN